VSKQGVHADLFKSLMTGRSGVAVAEWLGNRLTGRVGEAYAEGRSLMKWFVIDVYRIF